MNRSIDGYFCYTIQRMMHYKRLTNIVLCIALLWLASCNETNAPAEVNNPIALKFNLAADSNYQYIIDSKLQLQPEVNGNVLSITQKLKLVASCHVDNINRHGHNIHINYDRIIMSSDNGVNTKEYDSEDTTNHDPIFIPVGTLVNKPYNIMVSPAGDAVTVNELDTLNIVNDSSMRKLVLQCLNIYPSQAVKIGDSWRKTIHASTGFIHILSTNTYKLTSIDDNTIAHVEVTSVISPEDTSQSMAFKGVQNGEFAVDIKTGLIISGKLTQQLSGKIKLLNKVNDVSANAELVIFGSKKQSSLK
ncbi:MAG: hypothetical protein JST82_15685 [Bacteroidetes bacterium]|nr:hypothetical protein [Bacteroidota bacterium]